MSLDGITTHFLAKELHTQLAGGRIDKVYQIGRYDLTLLIRNDSVNLRLFLSANPSGPRIHLTSTLRDNPALPPSFCMFLRKHLSGARILYVTCPNFERIIEIGVQATDELGDRIDKRLIIEMMGRYSNIILVNAQDRILDSLLHVDAQMSRVREIMPARIYGYPPEQGKLSPADALRKIDSEQIPILDAAYSRPLEKALQDSLLGFSPELCREVCFLSGIDPRKGIRQLEATEIQHLLPAAKVLLERITDGIIQPAAYALPDSGSLYRFHALLLRDSGVPTFFSRISEAMDAVYQQKDSVSDFEQKKKDILAYVRNALDHATRKQNVHLFELGQCTDMDQDRLFGELILQNTYRIPNMAESFCATDYTSPSNEEIRIPLDPARTPAQNAQSYFRKYSKCKAKRASAEAFLVEDLQAIEYLQTLFLALETAADDEDLNAVADEMKESGLKGTKADTTAFSSSTTKHPGKSKSGGSGSRAIRAAGKAAMLRSSGKHAATQQKQTFSADNFRKYDAPDGFVILCGRNNLQNDRLTLKTASADDLWFHVQKMPGTHVILRTAEGSRREFTEAAVLAAAKTAAYFSRTMARLEKNRAADPRQAQNTVPEDAKYKIPVDYCPVKNVKKPPKAKPGMVIYEHYQTVFVSPEVPAKSI